MKPKKTSLVRFAPPTKDAAPAVPVEVKPKRIKRQKVFILTPEQEEQLDAYCFHAKTTIQAVVIEGINSVLRAKGLPELKS